MPGLNRWHPSDEPFSYTKLCIAIPGLVFAGALLVSIFVGDHWLPSSNALGVALVGGTAFVTYIFFLKVVWRLLPVGVRARIPYDREEAQEFKRKKA